MSMFDWLHLNNLEIKLVDFQESALGKTEFIDLTLMLQEKEVKPSCKKRK